MQRTSSSLVEEPESALVPANTIIPAELSAAAILPYACDLCDKRSHNQRGLNIHRAHAHGVKVVRAPEQQKKSSVAPVVPIAALSMSMAVFATPEVCVYGFNLNFHWEFGGNG